MPTSSTKNQTPPFAAELILAQIAKEQDGLYIINRAKAALKATKISS